MGSQTGNRPDHAFVQIDVDQLPYLLAGASLRQI
jgi:hypothetical protein